VAQEGDALFKDGAFRRLNLKTYTMEAGENNVEALQKFLLGRRIHNDIIKITEANAP